jgi:hypothetical protein
MFSGIRDLLHELAKMAKNEARQGIIKLAEYIIVKCGGVPPRPLREPYTVVPPAPMHSAPAKISTDRRFVN